jgi:hypothetical protein
MQKLVVTLSFMTVHKHFHEYVYRTHGDAETAGCRSPFTGDAKPVCTIPAAAGRVAAVRTVSA